MFTRTGRSSRSRTFTMASSVPVRKCAAVPAAARRLSKIFLMSIPVLRTVSGRQPQRHTGRPVHSAKRICSPPITASAIGLRRLRRHRLPSAQNPAPVRSAVILRCSPSHARRTIPQKPRFPKQKHPGRKYHPRSQTPRRLSRTLRQMIRSLPIPPLHLRRIHCRSSTFPLMTHITMLSGLFMSTRCLSALRLPTD